MPNYRHAFGRWRHEKLFHFGIGNAFRLRAWSHRGTRPACAGQTCRLHCDEIDVTNIEAYTKEYAPLAQASIKTSGGKLLAAGQKVTALEGAPPSPRVAIQAWDSLATAQAWRNGAEYKKAREIGNKYAKFRAYAIEGLPQ